MDSIQKILKKPLLGDRIQAAEALYLLKNAHWGELAKAAHEYRVKKTSSSKASFTIFRIINYTNVCMIKCSFCSFMKNSPLQKGTYVLGEKEIDEKIDEALRLGAFQVFLQGGVHPDLKLDYYLDTLSHIKKKYGIHIRGFSPVELHHLARNSKIPLKKLLIELRKAGLDSVPGAGAEILSERVRKILSPHKLKVSQWLDVLQKCHEVGLQGSANIVFGSIETPEEIIAHLEAVRSLQDKTGGFFAFIPWTFQPQTKNFTRTKVAPHLYLTILALSRLYLDNIVNIEASVLAMGKELGALALHSGANDINSPVLEENVLRSYGIKSEAEAIQFIKNAGFIPIKRDFSYQTIKEYGENQG